ncbi:mitochondrial matrix iron-sulfur protein [Coemansia spiralis]|uniref:2Fe-2S ferredoxin n=2 Tax=Coemansia TaxID=4863 RepID=A0A9W8GCF2_9FUNG|nr:2Fe-2S ferredoxin-type domain-containing protein [Coemansia spiralis]KAJ1993644.1 mitochondrial matrix iron-sulfur protein [Coemansia umbellata]KAJ2679399.1 mitochondrial matrix iron-sulfur protein [Coemansia spiralis]
MLRILAKTTTGRVQTCMRRAPQWAFTTRAMQAAIAYTHSTMAIRHRSPFSVYAPIAKQVTVTFIEPDGHEVQAAGEEGTNLMELAHENDVDLEGACEGACACSTCHVILEDKIYDELPEPTDEENDMLDLAFGLTDTSRLGCQVQLTPEMEGMRIKLPSATRNFYVDGAKPAHH